MNDRNDRSSASEGFHEALSEVVYEAVIQGIDVEGGWDLSERSDGPDFTVEIYRLDSDAD